MIRPLYDPTYRLNMPSFEEKCRKRIKHLYRIYNANRNDPDLTMKELQELAFLMENQVDMVVVVPDLSEEILEYVEEIKRLVREHFTVALKPYQPSNRDERLKPKSLEREISCESGECECWPIRKFP